MKVIDIYLKFDSATRIHTNYLGVNARYVHENRPKTETLDIVDTKSRHTAKDVKAMIVECIKKYDVPLDKVLVSVTDNAANMVRTLDLLNEVSFNF